MGKVKLNLVDNKRVAIIKSNEHTYNIRYIKSGKFQEIHKRYLRTVYIEPKPQKPRNNPNNQQNLFNI